MEYSDPVSTPLGKQCKISVDGAPLVAQTPPLKLHSVSDTEITVLASDVPQVLAQWFETVREHNVGWYRRMATSKAHTPVDLPLEGLYVFKLKETSRKFKAVSPTLVHVATQSDVRPGCRAVIYVRAPMVRLTKRSYGAVWYVDEICVLEA